MRSIAEMISEGFIWGIGITRPRPGRERVAAYYITGILVLTLVVLCTLFFVLQKAIR